MSTSRFGFDAIGTAWEVDTPAPLDAGTREEILGLVVSFDRTYSRFRKDSMIARVSEAVDGGSFVFPSEAAGMFDLYDRLYVATDGAVDPLIGRDLELLGYDREYSLLPLPIDCGLQRASWRRDVLRNGSELSTRKPLTIDLGAVGKGYLVDLVADVLEKAGFRDFIVDGSGDMRHAGGTALEVGLEHPLDPTMVIGVASLLNRSLCASAANRRRWGDNLHHVLDGRTGGPTMDVIATWAIAADTATADGLATALFFGSASRLKTTFDFSYVRMFADGRVEVSEDFEGELFI
ncbi:FAD:protein FMN transferase [Ensifer sp. ENS09]|uniref:FAD:protein FMN transferase n=1 Tax=Ensifer sp. ENS09 TaxID=2769263 RepID=UPI001784F546|nr:FAD:protein FMN transferase [Ensifer sp. ENS09]MBD9651455.1 FAD:protein FMN transferase [Ensifer sp. ENS09]